MAFHWVADADIVIAASDAQFFDPHVSIGQVVSIEAIGLMRKMPVEAVMRMALVGRHERMSAERAYELGMISEVVDPPERLRERAQELGEKIARNSPGGDGRHEAGPVGRPRARPDRRLPGRRRGAGVDVGPPRPGRGPAGVRREAGAAVGASHVRFADLLHAGEGHDRVVLVDDVSYERESLTTSADELSSLLASLGAGAGTVVAACLPTDAAIVAALFGVWRAGAAFSPLNPRLAKAELASMAAELEPVAVLVPVGAALDGVFEGRTVIEVDGLLRWRLGHTGAVMRETVGPDIALVLYTSGTTGRPKPVLLRGSRLTVALDAVVGSIRPRAQADGLPRPPMPNLIPFPLSLWAGIYSCCSRFSAARDRGHGRASTPTSSRDWSGPTASARPCSPRR